MRAARLEAQRQVDARRADQRKSPDEQPGPSAEGCDTPAHHQNREHRHGLLPRRLAVALFPLRAVVADRGRLQFSFERSVRDRVVQPVPNGSATAGKSMTLATAFVFYPLLCEAHPRLLY